MPHKHQKNELGLYTPNDNPREIDYDMPIGISQVSNMLHVMFGFVPKPTYRKSIIERNEKIYEIAKKARIKYYDECDKDIYEKSEVLQGAKAPYNSERKIKTKIGDKLERGFFSWSYFLKRFQRFDKKYLDNILAFFNKMMNCDDVTKNYTFEEFVLGFEKYTKSDEVKNFIKSNPIYFKRGRILLGKMSHVIFKYMITVKGDSVTIENKEPSANSSNVSYNQPTPLLLDKDINQRVAKFSGEIMVEFDNEEIIERMHKCGTLPTILDGGLISIIGLYTEEDFPFTKTIYGLTYREISEQKGVEVTE
jgi:hypothetical protein